MPKRSYHTDDFVPTYESGYTKVARLQSELVSQSEPSSSSSSSSIVDNAVEFPMIDSEENSLPTDTSTRVDTPVLDRVPRTAAQGLLQELLQIEAPVYEDGPPNNVDTLTNDDPLFDQYFAENQDGGTVPDTIEHPGDVSDNEDKPPMDFGIVDHAMVDLIQCCNNAGTSIKFLDEILRTLKKHVKKGFDVLKAPKRSNFMEKLRARLGAPNAEIVASSHGYMVPRFDFLEQVLDLFSTPYFQDPASCCLNADELIRFLQYVPPEDEGDSEVMGAQWARQTFAQVMERMGRTYTDPDTGIVYINFFCPVIGYNDKTGVGAMEGKYTLEPLMFTLAESKARHS
jgi:hypothetical protein